MKDANPSVKQVLFRLSYDPDRITVFILLVWTLLQRSKLREEDFTYALLRISRVSSTDASPCTRCDNASTSARGLR